MRKINEEEEEKELGPNCNSHHLLLSSHMRIHFHSVDIFMRSACATNVEMTAQSV